MAAPSVNPSGPAAVHLMVQVWGDFYTGLLIDWCIPALLSRRNLPALAALLPCRFDIYTTEGDERRIRSAPIIGTLGRFAAIRFVRIDPASADDKYAMMTNCNIAGLREAAAANAAIVFLVPDTIWSDGTLETVANAIRAGKRMVMQTGVRITADTAWPELQERFAADADGVRTAPSRDLVRIAFDHMHPYFRGWFWDAAAFNRNPAISFWRVNTHGLIARCFHLHPLMLYAQRPVFDFVSTLDDDLPVLAVPNYEQVYVVEDSDEIFHIDLSEAGALGAGRVLEAGPSASYLATWARFSANVYHRRFSEHTVRFHTDPFGPEWDDVQRHSDAIMRAVHLRLRLWSAAVRVVEVVFGITRHAVIDRAAATRLGWDAMPAAPRWWRVAVGAMRRWGVVGPADALDARRRNAYVQVAQYVFGVNVACRGLGLDMRAYKRAHKIGRAPLWEPAMRGYVLRPSLSGLRSLATARAADGIAVLERRLRHARRALERGVARTAKAVRKGVRRTSREVTVTRGRLHNHIGATRKAFVRAGRRVRRSTAAVPRAARRYLARASVRMRRGSSSPSGPSTPC